MAIQEIKIDAPVPKTEAPKPSNWFALPNVPLREPRKIRLITVGAGFSGLMMAYNIQHKLKLEETHIDHQIYEKNHEVGGTWLENSYLGAACDVPSHIYTFPWAPNPDWSAYYVEAPEILEYIKKTADKFDLKKNVQFNTKLVEAVWYENLGLWKLKLENKAGEVFEDQCEIFADATGFLNKWSWPTIPGLKEFKGDLVHSASWNHDVEYENKKVAVIGNGSSALQIVPNLQKKLGLKGHMWNFIRNPTWVSVTYLSQFTRNGDGKNFKYTEEEKREFRENPEAFFEYRKQLEDGFNKFFYVLIKDSPDNLAAQAAYTEIMKERLNHEHELIEKLIPKWEVGCRRLSPGEGYLESFSKPNVTPEFSPIVKVTKTGIQTEKEHIELDSIICATGFDVSYSPRWKMRGENGADLAKEWAGTPKAYMSICTAKMPNYFIFNGPNACAGHGSLLAVMDWTADYVCRWAVKIAEEDIKSVTVSSEVVDDWNVWAQEQLKTTVWSGGCTSWYRKASKGEVGEAVTGMYPGSVIHFKEMTDVLRLEDFEVRYRSNNRFKFLGNGLAQLEKRGEDLSFYVQKPPTAV